VKGKSAMGFALRASGIIFTLQRTRVDDLASSFGHDVLARGARL